jgi:hypothetical protein
MGFIMKKLKVNIYRRETDGKEMFFVLHNILAKELIYPVVLFFLEYLYL